MLENKYKTGLCERIRERFPGSYTLHLSPNEIQGIPDLIVLLPNGRWVALEVKKNANATHRPNQDWYVADLDTKGFAAFIYPENEEEVLNEIQRSFSFD